MKTIAISNQKGGVGKTTTAVSLSVALARQGKRVLLIDADSQADATKYLGVENPDELQNTLSAAMHCIINDLPYKTGGYIQSHPEGLDFVPSSIDLSSVELELVNAMSRERILKTFLDDVRGKYDYVLIDCGAGVGESVLQVALSAGEAIVVTTPTETALRDGERMAAKLRAGGMRQLKLVINRINVKLIERGRAPDVDKTIDTLAVPLLGLVPEEPAIVALQNEGKSIFDSNLKKTAIQVADICMRLCGAWVPLRRIR